MVGMFVESDEIDELLLGMGVVVLDEKGVFM